MILDFTERFKKNYRRRIVNNPKLAEKFQERLDIFTDDSSNSVLKDHKLDGNLKDFRAFSITGDIRIIYRVEGNIIRFYDIGSHNQVY